MCQFPFFFMIQSPKSDLMASMEFFLRRMIVERWKNFVFLSPSVSQISRDFCFQIVSILASHSFRSLWSFASSLTLSIDLSLLWISTNCSVRPLIRVWQKPNMFLFQYFNATQVAFCFLQSSLQGNHKIFSSKLFEWHLHILDLSPMPLRIWMVSRRKLLMDWNLRGGGNDLNLWPPNDKQQLLGNSNATQHW